MKMAKTGLPIALLASSVAYAADLPTRPEPDIVFQANGIVAELRRERDDAQNAALNYAAENAVLKAQLAKAQPTPQGPLPKK